MSTEQPGENPESSTPDAEGKSGTKRRKVKLDEFANVLKACDGIASETAKRLGITSRGARQRIQKSAFLRQIQTEAQAKLVDLAESQLKKAVSGGNMKAVLFTLQTLGRDRGYGRNLKVDASVTTSGQVVLYFPDDGREAKPDGTKGTPNE
jgi:hypothetical protein